MTPWYAQNARLLLQNRQHGITPDGPVVVSLVAGEFDLPTLFVHADMPIDRLDWRMLVNLTVWVWASAKAPIERVLETVYRIAIARPKELILRFEHGDEVHDVEVGYGHHLPGVAGFAPVHQFQWAPINVGGTALGRRLKRALLSKKPNGVFL